LDNKRNFPFVESRTISRRRRKEPKSAKRVHSRPIWKQVDSSNTLHATRGLVAKTPYFLETISCPAVIMGETGDSGHGLGFGEMAKLRGQPPFWTRFAGCDRGDLPDSKSGLIISDFRCENWTLIGQGLM